MWIRLWMHSIASLKFTVVSGHNERVMLKISNHIIFFFFLSWYSCLYAFWVVFQLVVFYVDFHHVLFWLICCVRFWQGARSIVTTLSLPFNYFVDFTLLLDLTLTLSVFRSMAFTSTVLRGLGFSKCQPQD